MAQRRSRTTSKAGARYAWVDAQDPSHDNVVQLLRWILSLPEAERLDVIGRITALRNLAADGLIDDGDDELLDAIRRNPDVWELRWNFDGVLVRQYHAEPAEAPSELIDLHAHIKEIFPNDQQAIDDSQDVQISQGLFRYKIYRGSRRWS